jgi:outer membrane protein
MHLKLRLRYLFASIFLFHSYAAYSCEPPQDCLLANSWQLSVAVGLGVRSNPLVDGDNIPLVILPDIAWYGEAAYFDNGELGYQWYDKQNQAFTTFMHIDSERAFFSFSHAANIFSSLTAVDSNSLETDFSSLNAVDSNSPETDVPEQPDIPELSKDKVASRDWAVNAGIRWHYRRQNAEWKVSIEREISGVHQGAKFQLSYRHHWLWQDWQISLTPAVVWKSDKLIDYYYGIDARDNVDSQFFYQGTAGWQPRISLSLQKPLNDRWLWLLRASYQRLHSGMSDSPLVREENIQSVFFGLAYGF